MPYTPRRPECAEPALAIMAAHEQRRPHSRKQQLEQLLLMPPGDPADDLEALTADEVFDRATGQGRR